MSFKATISVGGKKFDLIYCDSKLEQKSDNSGRPASGVAGGILWLIMDGTDDDTFGTWATDPTKKQDGTITFYRIDQDSKFKEIEFKGAYLTDLVESFIIEEDIGDIFKTEYFIFNDAVRHEIYDLIKETQNRTGTSYVIFCRLSAEKIKIDGVEHDNKW